MTYAVVTPIVKRAGAYHFDVYRPTDKPTDMPIQHTYRSRELAWCGRMGWISYYRQKHVKVRDQFYPDANSKV
jgi:hypothetical protein